MLEDELKEALRERDDAEDFIDELLDEVLGADRPEWSSAYNRYDAMNDVRERITALHKPAADKAWGRFESVTAEPKPSPAAQGDVLDAAFEAVRKRLCKLPRYSFALDSRSNLRRCEERSGNWIEFDAVHALFDPVAIDAARAAQEGK